MARYKSNLNRLWKESLVVKTKCLTKKDSKPIMEEYLAQKRK